MDEQKIAILEQAFLNEMDAVLNDSQDYGIKRVNALSDDLVAEGFLQWATLSGSDDLLLRLTDKGRDIFLAHDCSPYSRGAVHNVE